MNILYIHGFGSAFSSTNQKVVELGDLGDVYGVDIDYTLGFLHVSRIITDAIHDYEIDLLIGTSMGGYMAQQIGAMYGIPFVMINPPLSPSSQLKMYLGSNVDHLGNPYILTDAVLLTYPDFSGDGCGLVLLDAADDVIDVTSVQDAVVEQYITYMFDGGSHRFEHMAESLPIIQSFYQHSSSYGLGD